MTPLDRAFWCAGVWLACNALTWTGQWVRKQIPAWWRNVRLRARKPDDGKAE